MTAKSGRHFLQRPRPSNMPDRILRVLAERLGIVVDCIPGDWRHPVDADEAEARLTADKAHAIKAVMVVHTETSTGVTSDVLAIRRALDRAKPPALLLVDTISSLAV